MINLLQKSSALSYQDGGTTFCISTRNNNFIYTILKGIFEYENIDLVVTDNLSDLELVKKSSKSIILSTPKNIGFWERNGLTVDYILED